MASFLYRAFVSNQLTQASMVDFANDQIYAALFRSSSYTANQNADEYLIDAGTPIATTLLTITVSANVVDANDFTFTPVPAGADIDVLVIYKNTGNSATSLLIAKYDISISPDGGDVTISVPTNGLFTLGAVGALEIDQGGTGEIAKTPAFDALAPSTTKGDLIVHDGTDNVRLAKGTDGHYLTANSATDTGLEWSAVDASPLTTKGDLYTFDTDDARLARGADGTYLKANSATGTGLEWGAIAAGDVPNLDASKITSGIMNIAQIPAIPAANVSAGTFPAGAFTFTTSVSAPQLIATDTSTATESADVAVNGTFDVDANWTKGTGWTIAGGVATKTAGTQSDLSQSVGQAANQVVRVRFNYTRTAGVLSVILGGTTHTTTYSSASGSVDIYIRATNTGVLSFRGDASFAGTIDNVVVNRITARTPAVVVPFAGTGNIGIGSGALAHLVTGVYNFAIGNQSGSANTTGNGNSFFGHESGYNNTTGSYSNFFGYQAGRANTIGQNNNFFGYRAGYNNTTGSNNIYIGLQAGLANTTGQHNNFFGYSAGYSNVNGGYNIFVGDQTGFANISGNFNSFIGRQAGYSNVNGGYNIFVGDQAGYFETASNLLIFAVSNTSTPPIRGIMSGATATIVFHSQNVASNVLQVQGIASQTGDLQRWNDSTGANLAKVTANGSAQFVAVEIDGDLNHDGSNVGFYGTAPAAKGTVTGSRGGNAALESLLTALANIGLITDSSTA